MSSASHQPGDHPLDPCYLVETAAGEYVGHSGRESLAEELAERNDDREPEAAPHAVRETSFEELRELIQERGADE